jgi:hypothetical protein
MVATKSRFPTVRYALVVCSYDDFGTPAYVTLKADASFSQSYTYGFGADGCLRFENIGDQVVGLRVRDCQIRHLLVA